MRFFFRVVFCLEEFGLEVPAKTWLDQEDTLDEEGLRHRIEEILTKHYAEKEAHVGLPVIRQFEKSILLQVLDNHWREHLAAMDHLRQGIHWRGYAQKNPKQEYKRESYQLFAAMLESIKAEVIRIMSNVKIQTQAEVDQLEQERQQAGNKLHMNFEHQNTGEFIEEEPVEPAPPGARVTAPAASKVGRNDLCPCGSGKKFKQCHGKLK